MRIGALHLDDALSSQPRLVDVFAGRAAEVRDLGPRLRLWSRDDAIDELRARIRAELPPTSEPELIFAGSGDFHHVSAILIERALEKTDAALTLVHLDNHPDWVTFANGMHCGSWVGRAARLPGVTRTITLGVTSPDIDRPECKQADLALIKEERVLLFPYRTTTPSAAYRICGREWPTIEVMGELAFIQHLPAYVETDAIYVTIDKDVLRPRDAVTNWDQGAASLDFVLSTVRTLAAHKRIVGADVVGDYSPAVYGGSVASRASKFCEALLDQPWRRPDRADAARVNEEANLQLVTLFGECMA